MTDQGWGEIVFYPRSYRALIVNHRVKRSCKSDMFTKEGDGTTNLRKEGEEKRVSHSSANSYAWYLETV